MILYIDSRDSKHTIVKLMDQKSKIIYSQKEERGLGSQVLLPLIVKVLKRNKTTLKDLSAIKVELGPGSFTGTRVGIAIANALSFALGIPVNGQSKVVIPVYAKSKFD